MATAWPLIKGWLVDTIPTLGLTGVTVFNGPPVGRSAPRQYVAVGFVEDDNAGTYSKTAAYDGLAWTEVGDIRTRIAAQAGDTDSSVTQDRAFAIADAIDAAIHADWTLGDLLPPETEISTSIDVLSISNGRGTATELVLVLRYSTTT